MNLKKEGTNWQQKGWVNGSAALGVLNFLRR